MEKFDIIIVGGGAAGLMAAIKASAVLSSVLSSTDSLLRVAVLEKMPSCGRKIRITGKGRCNITNTRKWNEFSLHVHPDPKLFRPAFYSFSNEDTMRFFENIGLPLVVERGDRVYPASMKASDVVDVLLSEAEKRGVVVITSSPVISVAGRDGGFVLETCGSDGCGKTYSSRALVIATGGLSYPATGSDGSGYALAVSLGHKLTRTFPSLTALVPSGYDRRLEGISLKNVRVDLYESSVLLQSEFGDIDFTDGGIEGPVGFKISRRAVKSLDNGGRISVVIDLKPAVGEDELAVRIKREIVEGRYSEKTPIESVLRGFVPKAMIAPFVSSCKENSVKLSLNNLAFALKHWTFRVSGYVGYRRAVVTAGGIDMSEIRHKNLSSKLCEGLFFAGEILDLDADTGGYNLQIAFSTGSLAGESAARWLNGKR